MKDVQFRVKVGYNEFVFATIEEATLFAVTAKKTLIEDEEVCINVEWNTKAETEEE